ncbi:MAG: hypothetical protein ACQXXG_09910 [Candidatus Bathyarchaeia archaeon]|jgi:glutaredoxin
MKGIIKFERAVTDWDDDYVSFTRIDTRIPKEDFMTLYRAGAVKSFSTDEDYGGRRKTYWDWDEEKATPILQKLGYTVISSKETEKEAVENWKRETLRKSPNVFIGGEHRDFQQEYFSGSGHHILEVLQVLDEKDVEVDGVKAKVKTVIAKEDVSRWDEFESPTYKADKYLMVHIEPFKPHTAYYKKLE